MVEGKLENLHVYTSLTKGNNPEVSDKYQLQRGEGSIWDGTGWTTGSN